ncbi:MAG TPA: ABC transporter ATP-binding protein [Candidatus Bathyarchaeia archaeon]|nr:ABC transporter ATP-binding protein [Candidatus Bathyarchaeia archaeon]
MKTQNGSFYQLRRILSFLRPYWRISAIATLMLIGSVIADLAIPQLIQRTIDEGIAPRNGTIILNYTILMIAIALVDALLTIGNTIFSVRASQRLASDVRSAAFRKIQGFSFGNLDKFQTGQLVVRLTSDVNQIQIMTLISLRLLIRAPLMIVGSILLMYLTSPDLSLVVLFLLPLALVLTGAFVLRSQPMFLGVQRRLDRLNTVLQEYLAGVRVVKAFVRSDHEIARFDKANRDLAQTSTRVAQFLSLLIPTMFFIINLAFFGVVWFGGQQVIAGKFSVGQILAFTNYLLSSLFPLLLLAFVAGGLSAASASAQRIYEVLDVRPEVEDKADAELLSIMRGKVAFEDVCFSYTQDCAEPAIREINLVAEPGQTVAILGATGSGKSTLVNLIPRFYDVTRGRVTIDDVDVRDVALNSLRSGIGVALQETVLFSGTVIDNIRYGRPEASEEEVIAVAKAAEAHDFIMSFPDGYKSNVGQRGVNLSGGQKQRIAIARALLIQPKILILDDSTSSVDVQTETRIQEQLEKLMENRTSFVIAQRISTVLRADKIVVLDRGKIVAEGPHEKLFRESPIYREIFESQLGRGEGVE